MARVEQPLVTRSWTTEETKLPFLQAHILFLRNKAKRSEIPEGISGASTSTATSGWMLPAVREAGVQPLRGATGAHGVPAPLQPRQRGSHLRAGRLGHPAHRAGGGEEVELSQGTTWRCPGGHRGDAPTRQYLGGALLRYLCFSTTVEPVLGGPTLG